MLERAWTAVTAHKTALLVILCLLLVCIAYAVGRYAGHEAAEEKTVVMIQEETQDARKLKNRLDISTANANALEKRITAIQEGHSAPTTTYYVTAPTVERAATVVERQIRTDDAALPMAVREKSDRTVVTPIIKDKDGQDLPPEQQKVDVYKINLRKDHRIKAGATMVDGKALMTVGYEQGRVEALAHFDGGKYKGATVMYNVAEW
ncbi:glycoprotease [uncultured Selenomonas sp.]|uniref:glycoprotease n=1 Tax=uncultured Selenomonas sp. TaxID=159275 RepID=UPI0026772AB8|nr:glycoprotease [uncultured Selenomonas sp.]